MTNAISRNDGVNGTGANQGEVASPGMRAWGKQQAPRRYHTAAKTVKTNWTKELS